MSNPYGIPDNEYKEAVRCFKETDIRWYGVSLHKLCMHSVRKQRAEGQYKEWKGKNEK